MSKIDRYKEKKENRDAFKAIRRYANERAERDRIEFAKAEKKKEKKDDKVDSETS